MPFTLKAIEANQNKLSIVDQKRQVLIMSLRAIVEEELAQREKKAIQRGIQ
ncbi:hypothetical protein WEU38_17740 [Cyanobacterium aponinum AL20118]|uniref:Uncharacterized protein n=1 Tax=Cyanobacterium aponinum AL20115 TaxID=3090662 RepID=A0AAF1C1F9_9CHRO|nr:hypothetical protein [Cyanobacterium aponinum]WPF88627.1 hypothetical protein SAY89_17830 [Cyanobacterium aponinum AL20115]